MYAVSGEILRARAPGRGVILEHPPVGVEQACVIMTGVTSSPPAGKAASAVGDLLQRQIGRAQRQRQRVRQRRPDAEPAHGIDDRVDAHLRDQLRRDGVDALGDRGAQRERAQELVLVVVRRPDARRGLELHRARRT